MERTPRFASRRLAAILVVAAALFIACPKPEDPEAPRCKELLKAHLSAFGNEDLPALERTIYPDSKERESLLLGAEKLFAEQDLAYEIRDEDMRYIGRDGEEALLEATYTVKPKAPGASRPCRTSVFVRMRKVGDLWFVDSALIERIEFLDLDDLKKTSD